MIPPAITAIIIAVVSALSFAGGWGVKGWKDGAAVANIEKKNESLESRNSILQTANSNCAVDIDGVKKGVAIIIAQVEERERAASDAMKAAELQIAQRKGRIKISHLPRVAPAQDAQCAAIVQEQMDYVRERKNAD